MATTVDACTRLTQLDMPNYLGKEVSVLTMRGNYVQSDASEAKVINSLDSWRSQALTDHENLQARARILARSLKEDQVIIKSLTSAEL